MVLLSELLSFFNYYFCIISGMNKMSYSERDGTFILRELTKLPKRATLLYTVYSMSIYSIVQ